VDGTGFESRHTSRHYARRANSRRFLWRRYIQLTVACHTQSHLWAGAEVQLGPANESPQFTGVMDQAAARVRWARVLADAAFDAERHHQQCRDDYGIRSTVIPVNRRRAGRRWPRSRYRRQMRRRFFKRVYGQRWQAESAFSRHKRLLGDALRSRSLAAWERECYLRVLTHNLMILAAAGP
jgi:Transposase DDE domain